MTILEGTADIPHLLAGANHSPNPCDRETEARGPRNHGRVGASRPLPEAHPTAPHPGPVAAGQE